MATTPLLEDPWPTTEAALETARLVADHAARVYGSLLESVWLYGSRARGDHRPDSDLDVLLVTTRKETNPHTLRSELRRHLVLEHFPPEMMGSVFLQTAYSEQFTDWDTMFYRSVRADAVQVR